MTSRDKQAQVPEPPKEVLPTQPHAVMQEAREEGIIAEEDDEDIKPVTLFDEPEEAEGKTASLNSEDRALIRIARATKSPKLRRRLVKLVVVPND